MNNDSLISRLIHRVTRQGPVEEARVIVRALDGHDNLRRWLSTIVATAGHERAAMLTRAAQTLRDELGEFTCAAILQQLAGNPALLAAVICELRSAQATAQAA
jgi:hypothetical protein